jgi:voltage-gated potassium channel Kch
MQGIPFVAIDHDPDNIELLRKFGFKVYYGDASRVDLLESAGIQKAKFLILAIDDVEASLKTVKIVKEHFPHIRVFARARNRGHYFDLLEEGVHKVKRETFDSSVNFVKDLLLDMGFTQEHSSLLIDRFKRHDEAMIKEQFKVRKDDKAYISVSNQAIEQLNQVLQDESIHTYIELNPKES